MQRFFATQPSTTLLFQRLVLGAVILPHGLQKAFGWFGGFGFEGTLAFFQSIGVPAPLGLLVLGSDLIGSLALILGLGTRLAAFGTAATMLGAILLLHAPNGFFMNWGGTLPGEGFEFHLLALGLAMPLIVRGAGAHSLDERVARWLSRLTSPLSPARSLP